MHPNNAYNLKCEFTLKAATREAADQFQQMVTTFVTDNFTEEVNSVISFTLVPPVGK